MVPEWENLWKESEKSPMVSKVVKGRDWHLQMPPFWQAWFLQSLMLISHLAPSQPSRQVQNT